MFVDDIILGMEIGALLESVLVSTLGDITLIQHDMAVWWLLCILLA